MEGKKIHCTRQSTKEQLLVNGIFMSHQKKYNQSSQTIHQIKYVHLTLAELCHSPRSLRVSVSTHMILLEMINGFLFTSIAFYSKVDMINCTYMK